MRRFSFLPLKKFFLLLSMVFLSLFLFSKSSHIAHAASPGNIATLAPEVERNNHTLTQSLFFDFSSAISCAIIGIDPVTTDHKCIGYMNNGQLGYITNNKGLIGLMTSSMSNMYVMPLHTVDSISYLQQNFGFTGKAYAQQTGQGFLGIAPLFKIWEQMRNIVYLFFVAIFAVIGFAIMLRVKIDPRTVMTIENQIPKLIIGILLVTFSAAIAGLFIDLMWLLTFLVINIMAQVDGNISGNVTINLYKTPIGFYNGLNATNTGDAGSFIWTSTFSSAGAIIALIGGLFQGTNVAQQIAPGLAQTGCNFLDFGCYLRDIFFNILGLIFGVLGGVIGFLVILIAIFVTLFRIWFMLLKCYALIIIDIIMAPWYIALGLLPGGPLGFGAYIRSLSANLSVFPVIVAVLLLIKFIGDTYNAPSGDPLFIPPLIGGATGSGNPLVVFLQLGLLFIAPQLAETIKEAIKAPKNTFGTAIGQGFGAGVGAVKGGAGMATTYFTNPQSTSKGARLGRVLGRIFG